MDYFDRMLTHTWKISRETCANETCEDKERMWYGTIETEKERKGKMEERRKKKRERAVYDWTGRKGMCEKRNLLYVGIGKFRCETKKGVGGYRRRDEMHQACGSGFVRPPLCLSFSALHCTCSSYFYRLWQFPRRTLWARKREKARLCLRVSPYMY